MKSSLLFLLALAGFLFYPGPTAAQPPTLAEGLTELPEAATFTAALRQAGLFDELADPEAAFTLIVPTEAAFAELPDGLLAALLDPAHADQLRQLLRYHVLPAATTPAEVLTERTTDSGAEITPTQRYRNGSLRLSDTVLLPPDLVLPKQ